MALIVPFAPDMKLGAMYDPMTGTTKGAAILEYTDDKTSTEIPDVKYKVFQRTTDVIDLFHLTPRQMLWAASNANTTKLGYASPAVTSPEYDNGFSKVIEKHECILYDQNIRTTVKLNDKYGDEVTDQFKPTHYISQIRYGGFIVAVTKLDLDWRIADSELFTKDRLPFGEMVKTNGLENSIQMIKKDFPEVTDVQLRYWSSCLPDGGKDAHSADTFQKAMTGFPTDIKTNVATAIPLYVVLQPLTDIYPEYKVPASWPSPDEENLVKLSNIAGELAMLIGLGTQLKSQLLKIPPAKDNLMELQAFFEKLPLKDFDEVMRCLDYTARSWETFFDAKAMENNAILGKGLDSPVCMDILNLGLRNRYYSLFKSAQAKLRSLTPEELKTLTPDVLPTLPPEALKKLLPETLISLSSDVLKKFPLSVFQSFTPEVLNKLPTDVLQSLPDDLLKSQPANSPTSAPSATTSSPGVSNTLASQPANPPTSAESAATPPPGVSNALESQPANPPMSASSATTPPSGVSSALATQQANPPTSAPSAATPPPGVSNALESQPANPPTSAQSAATPPPGVSNALESQPANPPMSASSATTPPLGVSNALATQQANPPTSAPSAATPSPGVSNALATQPANQPVSAPSASTPPSGISNALASHPANPPAAATSAIPLPSGLVNDLANQQANLPTSTPSAIGLPPGVVNALALGNTSITAAKTNQALTVPFTTGMKVGLLYDAFTSAVVQDAMSSSIGSPTNKIEKETNTFQHVKSLTEARKFLKIPARQSLIAVKNDQSEEQGPFENYIDSSKQLEDNSEILELFLYDGVEHTLSKNYTLPSGWQQKLNGDVVPTHYIKNIVHGGFILCAHKFVTTNDAILDSEAFKKSLPFSSMVAEIGWDNAVANIKDNFNEITGIETRYWSSIMGDEGREVQSADTLQATMAHFPDALQGAAYLTIPLYVQVEPLQQLDPTYTCPVLDDALDQRLSNLLQLDDVVGGIVNKVQAYRKFLLNNPKTVQFAWEVETFSNTETKPLARDVKDAISAINLKATTGKELFPEEKMKTNPLLTSNFQSRRCLDALNGNLLKKFNKLKQEIEVKINKNMEEDIKAIMDQEPTVTMPFTPSMQLGSLYNIFNNSVGRGLMFEDTEPVVVHVNKMQSDQKKVLSVTDARTFLNVSSRIGLGSTVGADGASVGYGASYLKDWSFTENCVEILENLQYHTSVYSIRNGVKPVEGWKKYCKGSFSPTHYVRSIKYGGYMLCSFRYQMSENALLDSSLFDGQLRNSYLTSQVGIKRSVDQLFEQNNVIEDIQIRYWSSVNEDKGTLSESLDNLQKTMDNFVDAVRDSGEGRGIPLFVELAPIGYADPSAEYPKLRPEVERHLSTLEALVDETKNISKQAKTLLAGLGGTTCPFNLIDDLLELVDNSVTGLLKDLTDAVDRLNFTATSVGTLYKKEDSGDETNKIIKDGLDTGECRDVLNFKLRQRFLRLKSIIQEQLKTVQPMLQTTIEHSAATNQFLVTVLQCKNLPGGSRNIPDAYVTANVALLKGNEKENVKIITTNRTEIKKSCNPIFNVSEPMVFDTEFKDLKNYVILFEVYDKNLFQDTLVGKVQLPVITIRKSTNQYRRDGMWVQLNADD